jgi:hypothetical protein
VGAGVRATRSVAPWISPANPRLERTRRRFARRRGSRAVGRPGARSRPRRRGLPGRWGAGLSALPGAHERGARGARSPTLDRSFGDGQGVRRLRSDGAQLVFGRGSGAARAPSDARDSDCSSALRSTRDGPRGVAGRLGARTRGEQHRPTRRGDVRLGCRSRTLVGSFRSGASPRSSVEQHRVRRRRAGDPQRAPP